MVYVTSDLHGYPLEKFQELLQKADFSDDDYCFVLGDVIDRGPQSVELLQWMMLQPNVELILGNHEAMLLACSFLLEEITEQSVGDLQANMHVLRVWTGNGGDETLKQLTACDRETVSQLMNYLREAPLYDTVCVKDKKFLLVHSGLGGFSPDKKITEYAADELLWTRPSIVQTYFEDTITVFGHTPTHFYGENYRGKAVFRSTWIDIDTGAACGGSPMLLRLDDMKEFYM